MEIGKLLTTADCYLTLSLNKCNDSETSMAETVVAQECESGDSRRVLLFGVKRHE